MRTFGIVIGTILSFTTIAVIVMQPYVPVWADDEHRRCKLDWTKLNLTPEQSREIEQLNAQFNNEYNEIKPVIDEEKRKLTQLLADRSSDPVEIMSLEQSLNRKKAELHAQATANYLKKRQLLNEHQQCILETMIRQAVEQRRRAINPTAQSEAVPDRIQNLLQKVRNVLPAQPER